MLARFLLHRDPKSMVLRTVRFTILLIVFTGVFILGVLVGSSLYGSKRDENLVRSSATLTDKSPSVSNEFDQVKLKDPKRFASFSFAYNGTHLWSMRLADENYLRTARLLPCRTVEYVGGPTREKMSNCDKATEEEFSVESTLEAQKWLYEHQNPADCSNKKFAIIHQFAWSGFGSTVHQIVWAFGVALGEGRIAVYEKQGNWLYCPSGTPDCLFLPISNCSVPNVVDGVKTVRIKADFGHWSNPIFPPVFQGRSFNWYRSHLLFYLMRYNAATLAHVQKSVAEYFKPPSIDENRPYVAIYVRRSDKVQFREMSQAYPLTLYFDLFDRDARLANMSTVYVNSEDENVFSEFQKLPKEKRNYYRLLSIKARRNVVFMALAAMQPVQRKPIVLEFLTDLFIEAHADLHVGTLTSNWCRLVDEVRLALGKRIPYYTPENRFLIDM